MLRNLDPRPRLILSLTLSSLALLYRQPLPLALLFFLSLLLLLLAGISPSRLWGQIRGLLLFLLILFFIQGLFYPGTTPVWTLGPLTLFTIEGLLIGLGVVLRLAVIITLGMILAASPPRQFIQALTAWKLPYEIAYMVSLGIRFLPLLREEARDVLMAIQLRGVNLQELSLRERLHTYTRIFMPLLTMGLLRSRAIAMAMEARAFRAYPRRTYLHSLPLKNLDYAVILLTLLFFACMLYLWIQGGIL